jgi:selenide,water dikinase
LAGGHTIDSNDPIFGLAVTGRVQIKHLKKNNGGKAGDLLFLTKALGTGILSTAIKRGLLQDPHYKIVLDQMTSLNKAGEALGRLTGVHAMTDITGFGMLGHLIEMAEGSNCSAELDYSALKKIEGLDGYLQQRTIPDATFRNWNSYSTKVQFDKGVNVMEAFNLLPDPQTNGGLLIAADKNAVSEVTKLLEEQGLGDFLRPIGRLIEKEEKTIRVMQ